ncbi:MAG: hypothetical protein LBS00_08630 [Synergistaceae bacterium]|nr:hypothetical protein [Synergistaceae bacterium]
MSTHIEDKSEKKKESDEFSDKEREQLGKVLDLLYAKLKEFDIATVKDEQHLRTLIMDRVLKTATEFFTVRVTKENDPQGTAIPLMKLPQEEQEEYLNKLMLKILEDIEGPGPVLRRSIARLILDYRLLLRMREKLETLVLSSVKHRIASKGIRHLENKLSTGMFFLHTWPLANETEQKKKFLEIREKLLKETFENPEALVDS